MTRGELAFAGGTDDEFLVHADELAQRGDPRGELIHVQHALATKPKDRKLRAAQAALFAKHPSLVPPARPKRKNLLFRQALDWRLGYIASARVKYIEPDMLGALLDHPSARFLRHLEIEVGHQVAPSIVLQLARAPRPALRELVFDGWAKHDMGKPPKAQTYDVYRGHAHQKGDALWAALPHLQTLTVRAFRLFHALAHPSLRELIAIGYPFCTAAWTAPQLATLRWRVGRLDLLEASVGRYADVLDTALASNLPALRQIDLRGCEIENPYTRTTREAFDVTLRGRDYDVLLD